MAGDKKRKSLSPKTRFDVFKRDGFVCQYCGKTPPSTILEVDHIVPVAAGGDNKESNLLTSCIDCNRGKSDGSLKEIPPSLASQIADRKERSAQIAEYNKFLLEQRERDEETIRELGYYWHDKFMEQKRNWVFAPDRANSIRIFLKHLAPVEIMDAMDVAHGKFICYVNDEHYKTWNYFCGVCWRKIKGDGQDG